MKYSLVILLFFSQIFGQSIDDFYEIAQKNNLRLKQKQIEIQKSEKDRQKAFGKFFPKIDFNARYTKADGGRTIDLPLGQLLNPISNVVGQLAQGTFPQNAYQDQSIPLLREKEQETKIDIVQPVFNLRVYHNYILHKYLEEVKTEEKNAYEDILYNEIAKAYFNIQKAKKAVLVYEKANELLSEHLRVTKKLFEVEKVTKDKVLLAKSRSLEASQKLVESQEKLKLAKKMMNFLLNRDMETKFSIPENSPIDFSYSFENIKQKALKNRHEFKQIHAGKNAAETASQLSLDTFVPEIAFAATYGYQGEEYKIDDKHDFWMASGVVKWNLFNGFQDKLESEKHELELQKLELAEREARTQIFLQLEDEFIKLKTLESTLEAAELRFDHTKEAFRIVEGKYKNGMISQLELLNSQLEFTKESLNYEFHKIDINKQKLTLKSLIAEK